MVPERELVFVSPYLALCEMYPNTEFFLVRMRENTDQKKLCV